MERMGKCFTFDDIMNWAKEEYKDDGCVLQSIGWMDDNMMMDNATIMADLGSLDSAVTDPLFKKGEKCQKIMFESMTDEYKIYMCGAKLSWEQGDALEMLAQHISGYECFLQLFEEGCRNFNEGSNRDTESNRGASDSEAVEATMECVAGSSLENKLEKAFTDCMGGSNRRLGDPKRMERMDKCFTYDDVMKWAKEEYADDGCVLQSIGWMDNHMVMDNATIMADLGSLDSAVTEPLFKKGENCQKIAFETMTDEYKTYMCDLSSLSWEQGDNLEMLAMHISGYECFLQLFEEGCNNFIKG